MKGQVLGYVGPTGNAKSPHLHFEIHQANDKKQWWRGASLNPYGALKSGRMERPADGREAHARLP